MASAAQGLASGSAFMKAASAGLKAAATAGHAELVKDLLAEESLGS